MEKKDLEYICEFFMACKDLNLKDFNLEESILELFFSEHESKEFGLCRSILDEPKNNEIFLRTGFDSSKIFFILHRLHSGYNISDFDKIRQGLTQEFEKNGGNFHKIYNQLDEIEKNVFLSYFCKTILSKEDALNFLKEGGPMESLKEEHGFDEVFTFDFFKYAIENEWKPTITDLLNSLIHDIVVDSKLLEFLSLFSKDDIDFLIDELENSFDDKQELVKKIKEF